MASRRQTAAARRNIKKAASAAKAKRTISRLPKKTRSALGKEGAKAAKRRRAPNQLGHPSVPAFGAGLTHN
jgi:hypothetical protein